MRKKFMSIFLAVLTIGLVLPGISANANVEEETAEEKPYMKIYDGEFNLIESYDEKEMEKFYINDTGLKEAIMYAFPPLAKTYSFKATEFGSSIWVNQQASFYDLKSIAIEPASKIHQINVEVYSGSTRVRVVEVANFAVGINIPLGTANSSTSYHKIKLQNGSPNNWIYISSGMVFYDVQ